VTEPRCSAISRTLDEDLHATASIVRSWMLLEQPGPWGSEALTDSDLPADVAGPLAEQAYRHRFRVLLVRRPDHADRSPDATRRVFFAHSGRGRTWIEQRTLDRPAEVLDVDFARLGAGESVGFDRFEGRLHLVCTNGSHDPCCAQFGRPVAKALIEGGETSVWESSHLGGDRFAANLVALPHGLYFGRLGPPEAVRVVDAYRAGRIELAHYRGRAGDPFVVQAAERFVRAESGLLGLDDLEPDGRRQAGPGLVDVWFTTADGRRFEARVAVGREPTARRLNCGAGRDEQPPDYSLVRISPTSPDTGVGG
jgi:hypothetical protein